MLILRTMYTLAIVSLAACLLCPDGLVRVGAALLLLAGAVPWWKTVRSACRLDGLRDAAERAIGYHAEAHQCTPEYGPEAPDRR